MKGNAMRNIFADLSTDLDEEQVDVLREDHGVRIERIVSTGHSSPPKFWYEQDDHEWVIVLQGEAKLRYEGETEPIHMTPGDHLYIRAGRKHRVEWTSPDEPTVWLALFYPAS